jgi:hypothetical protein
MRGSQLLKTGAAQADTGQTTLVEVPSFARHAIFYLDYTATAGTTPLMDFHLHAVDATGSSTASDLGQWDGITQITGAQCPLFATVYVGPGCTGTTDDDTGTTVSATNCYFINTPLPAQLGAVVTLDRTTGNETYTYTLSVDWMS